MKTSLVAKLALAAALAPALSSCAAGKLPDYNVLGGLRVLAIKAEPPEVDPTGSPTVTLKPFVSDMLAGRSLSYEAVGCVDPGVGIGATPTCDGSPSMQSLGSGTIPNSNLDPTHFTYTGEALPIPVTIPSTILDNRNAADQYNGVAYLVIYTLKALNNDGSTSRVVSYKRVIASAATKTAKNTNPHIGDVKAGDVSLFDFLKTLSFPTPAGTETSLSIVLDPGSAETYTLVTASGPRTVVEEMTTTWFISDGAVHFYRTTGTDPDAWIPPQAQPINASGQVRKMIFVAVTRDGRGGEDYNIVEQQ